MNPGRSRGANDRASTPFGFTSGLLSTHFSPSPYGFHTRTTTGRYGACGAGAFGPVRMTTACSNSWRSAGRAGIAVMRAG